MTAIAILGLIVLVGVAVAWTTWHRVADERRSVQSHQHALDAMRHLGDHRVSAVATPDAAARRGASRPRAGSGAAPARRGSAAWSHGEAPVHVPAPRPGTRREGTRKQADPPSDAADRPRGRRRPALVFVDDAAEPSAPNSLRWAGRLGLVGGRHPRRNGLAAAGMSAVVLSVIVAVTIPSSAPTRGRHPAASPHGAVTPVRSSPTPAAGGGTTTSTQAPPADLSPATATAHAAGYTLSASSGYTLAIAATGLCWVMASAQPSGALVWTGTLFAGQSRTLSVSGGVQVRLGAASDVTVSVNGRPLVQPPGYQSPFDMNFETSG